MAVGVSCSASAKDVKMDTAVSISFGVASTLCHAATKHNLTCQIIGSSLLRSITETELPPKGSSSATAQLVFAIATTSFRWFAGFLTSENYKTNHSTIIVPNIPYNQVVSTSNIATTELYQKINFWYTTRHFPKETFSVIKKIKTLAQLYDVSEQLYIDLEIIEMSGEGAIKIVNPKDIIF